MACRVFGFGSSRPRAWILAISAVDNGAGSNEGDAVMTQSEACEPSMA